MKAMNLQDAIYNWLSIKVVCEERPNDNAAKETYEFFNEVLEEDHKINKIEVKEEGPWYIVDYVQNGEAGTKQYPKELVDALLVSIQTEPKYGL